MNPTQCGQFEMAIVDDILGNLPSNKSQALQDHLDECLSCRKLYSEWREILKDEKSVEPPVSLYNRLAKKFLRRHVRRKTLAPATIWGATSALLLGMLVLAIVAVQGKQPLVPREQFPIASEDIPSFVLDDTETVQYLINPQEGQLTEIKGIIWVNNRLDEIYCFVQNLEYNANHDYQIWLIKTVKRENGGLLRLMDEYGELYLQQRKIQEVQQISISREPKGGSLYPTTGDTILVDFDLQ